MIWLIAFLLAGPTPKWQLDWKSAFQLAKAEHRLVFVDYTQTEARCKPCWQMENLLLTNPDVQRRISDFILLRVDPDISAIPREHRYATPALVIFDWDGRERFRIDGERVLRVDDWHERSDENHPLYGPLERFRSEERAFVKAAELFDEQKDAEAYQLLAEAYERLHMTEHARAARARLAR